MVADVLVLVWLFVFWFVVLVFYEMPGRHSSPALELLGFNLIKVGNKYAAYCNVCTRNLKNTAVTRLQAHR